MLLMEGRTKTCCCFFSGKAYWGPYCSSGKGDQTTSPLADRGRAGSSCRLTEVFRVQAGEVV